MNSAKHPVPYIYSAMSGKAVCTCGGLVLPQNVYSALLSLRETSIGHSRTDGNEVGVNSEWPEKSLASVILSKCVCHDQSEQQREGICSRGKARQACQGVVQSDRADGLAHFHMPKSTS